MFENLDPKFKQWGMIGLGVLAIGFVIWLIDPGTESTSSREKAVIKNVLTDRSTRDIGMDALVAQVKKLQTDNEYKDREITDLKIDFESIKDGVGTSSDVGRQLAQIRSKVISQENKLKKFEKENIQLKRDLREFKKSGVPVNALNENSKIPEVAGPKSGSSSSAGNETAASYYFGQEINGTDPKTVDRKEFENSDESAEQSFEIVFDDLGEFSSEQAITNEEGEEQVSVYIPSSSILTGTLITGLDAPTGLGAKKDPFPVMLRIQHEAILPGRFTADVRECHLLLSGYGELSSERVMLRAETISCIREDGNVLESKLQAYAAGEDSKAGVRGRLKTKQGQVIAKSLVAGFFSGMSEAFDVNPIPVVNTGSSDSINWADVDAGNAAQSGVVGGAQNSLEKISEFYLKWADQMFPVLELDAGRQIEVVVSQGFQLLIK